MERREEPASLTVLFALTAAFVLCACIAAAVRAIAAVRGGRNARELVRENVAVKLRAMTAKAAIAYALLSFIFCADVAAAVVFYRRTAARRITDA